MQACQVDVLVSAPQKGWSGPPGAGLVMLSPLARERIDGTTSSSFACDLKKWLQIAEAYEGGGHAYHATLPTDSLLKLRDVMNETAAWGFENARAAQQQLGERVRTMLAARGFRSVAAPGFQAPGVVVSYTDDAELHNTKKMLAQGLQIAAGVPLQCDEPSDFRTFRIGLFGLDKLQHIDRTVHHLEEAIAAVQRS
jgi:aspartate aminotransferase-like enzyme